MPPQSWLEWGGTEQLESLCDADPYDGYRRRSGSRLLGLAHSVLGERYILLRLFRRELPPLFGDAAFTRNTLRFAWHLTTVLALGLSALLWQLANAPSAEILAHTPGASLIAGGLPPLLFTRGRHLAWVALWAAGALCLAWAAR